LPSASFTWHDGPRTVRFGRDALDGAEALLGEGYVLLTTARGLAAAPGLAKAARATHDVPAGRVDELAGDLLGAVDGGRIVALGGGRVVDVAKALASATGGSVAAVPTTLSAAEMTAVHRRARGAAQDTPGVRPDVVLNDPGLSASQPAEQLAASAANALGHAIEGPCTPRSSPVPELTAGEAIRLLAGDLRDRDALALGALLSGAVIDSTGYGLHHVLSQTLVRFAGVGHGPANAAMLPHTTAALRRRAPAVLARLDAAAGVELEALARRLAAAAGAQELRALGVTEAALEECVAEAVKRPDLAHIPPAAGEAEVRALYEAAW
jgi:alcohol dehydrogenase class IV